MFQEQNATRDSIVLLINNILSSKKSNNTLKPQTELIDNLNLDLYLIILKSI